MILAIERHSSAWPNSVWRYQLKYLFRQDFLSEQNFRPHYQSTWRRPRPATRPVTVLLMCCRCCCCCSCSTVVAVVECEAPRPQSLPRRLGGRCWLHGEPGSEAADGVHQREDRGCRVDRDCLEKNKGQFVLSLKLNIFERGMCDNVFCNNFDRLSEKNIIFSVINICNIHSLVLLSHFFYYFH